MDPNPGTRTEVIRLFPDYASSPIWFPDPVEYADARLSVELERDLRAWETSYYAGLDDSHFEWRSAADRDAFEEIGETLAQRLADELGSKFVVERIGDGANRRFVKVGRSKNPAAERAFVAMADASRKHGERLQEIRDEGGDHRWVAYRPLSGD